LAGRFDFQTHCIDSSGGVFNTACDLFTPLVGRGHYHTRGFREAALFFGCSEVSYRSITETFNRLRCDPKATKSRTVCNVAEREAAEVETVLNREVQDVLKKAGFSSDGKPPSSMKVKIPKHSLQPVKRVEQACRQAGGDSGPLPTGMIPFENPELSVYCSVDNVGVNRQKDCRQEGWTPPKETLKNVWTSVATVTANGTDRVLNARSVVDLMPMIMATIVCSSLLNRRLIFLTDGEKALKTAIFDAFSWYPNVVLILDWYHLSRKVGQLLSMGLNGSSKDKKPVGAQLRKLLWEGRTDQAIACLEALTPAGKVRNQTKVDELKTYLERHRTHIPSYAVRDELQLRNSSNRVEKANDQLVSQRQKRKGLSWTDDGSASLATLRMVRVNGQIKNWLDNHSLDLAIPDEEAA